MSQIYEFFAGRGSADAVLQAAAQDSTPQATMYANLYLGLYFEAAGENGKARTYIRKAATAAVPRNYMRDVAKVHLQQRHWDR